MNNVNGPTTQKWMGRHVVVARIGSGCGGGHKKEGIVVPWPSTLSTNGDGWPSDIHGRFPSWHQDETVLIKVLNPPAGTTYYSVNAASLDLKYPEFDNGARVHTVTERVASGAATLQRLSPINGTIVPYTRNPEPTGWVLDGRMNTFHAEDGIAILADNGRFYACNRSAVELIKEEEVTMKKQTMLLSDLLSKIGGAIPHANWQVQVTEITDDVRINFCGNSDGFKQAIFGEDPKQAKIKELEDTIKTAQAQIQELKAQV